MTKKIKLTNKAILELLGPIGASDVVKLAPRDILEKLSKEMEVDPRTIRRRLAEMVAQGDLDTEGAGPSTRYFLKPPRTNELQLSHEAQKIQQAVSGSMFDRPPARFERDFVSSYQPNKTFFLSETLRARLLQLGRSVNAQMEAGTYVREIMDSLVVDLAWASSALEGNTYSLGDTKELIERGQKAEGASASEAVMILNHREALRYLVERAATIDFDETTIFALHSLLADGLLPSAADEGRIRKRSVNIGVSRYVPLSSEEKIVLVFDEILAKARDIKDPFEQSFFAMAMIPYLQPFIDVNKRTSRLAANIPFIRQNLCPLSFVGTKKDAYLKGIVGLYETREVALLRDVFAHAYEISCERYPVIAASLDTPDPVRVRYRQQIKTIVSKIVADHTPQDKIDDAVLEQIQEIPSEDQDALRKLVIEDLASLHEGNIARFRLSRHDFAKWQESWPDEETRGTRLRQLAEVSCGSKLKI